MKRWIMIAMCGLFVAATGTASYAQQIPARGLSALVCVLGVEGDGFFSTPNGQLAIDVDDQSAGPGTATVTVFHGADDSTHYLTYQDNGDEGLDCGDIILSVQ